MSSISITPLRDDILQLTMDMPGKSANVLTDEVYADLDRALSTIESSPPAGLILVSAKPRIFVAGADLVKISQTLDWSDEKIIGFCEHGRAIMRRLSLLPSVSVAAIHGVCVGGGLELALWCDHRLLTDDPRTLLGLPEVKLGLVPGWAGTVRLPRLIGLQAAAELVTSGKLVSPDRSKALGMVTDTVSKDDLIDCAIKLIDSEIDSKNYLNQRKRLEGVVTDLPDDVEAMENKMLEAIESNTDVYPKAPRIVLEHMVRTASQDATVACASEAVAMSQVYGSKENAGLLHYFFLDERAKKTRSAFSVEDQPKIQTVGVIGAGLIGSQIIQLALGAGYQVAIYDADQPKQNRLVDKLRSVDGFEQAEVHAASDLGGLSGCQLVIESVVENLTVKRQIFDRLQSIVAADAFLASNTSTIPVSEIGESVVAPDGLLGLHFCCPVEPLRLIEVVRTPQTSDRLLNVGLDFVRRIRKTPVVMNDSAGFVVNRLLCPMLDQAQQLLQRGLTPRQIDNAFREFGFAVGPLEMIDFIGTDTVMYAGKVLLRYHPHCVSLTPILPALVKRNRLGRKTGAGFYRYDAPGDTKCVAADDPEFEKIWRNYLIDDTVSFSETEILERLLRPMVVEGQRLLEEKVVEDARDVDLCSILGTTFPAHRGGLMFWAEQNERG